MPLKNKNETDKLITPQGYFVFFFSAPFFSGGYKINKFPFFVFLRQVGAFEKIIEIVFLSKELKKRDFFQLKIKSLLIKTMLIFDTRRQFCVGEGRGVVLVVSRRKM